VLKSIAVQPLKQGRPVYPADSAHII
jgi:hypothetical protein